MESTDKLNPQELRIQGLLDRFLTVRSKSGAPAGQHLDEDALAAFVEGNISDREAGPMVTHLVDCSFCRHVTAELVKLDLELAPETETAREAADAAQPTKISEVLSGLFSKIFGNADAAVFAHGDEEKKEESEQKAEDEAK